MNKHRFKGGLLALAVMAGGAFAQTPVDNACQNDIQKFCAKVKKGPGLVYRCLKNHESKLSPACAEKTAAMRDHVKATMAACKEDVATYCPTVPSGSGKILGCLQSNASKISAACRGQIIPR